MSQQTVIEKRGGGLGFASLLTLVFVVFKLLGKITWSWWLVFSPILASLGLAVTLLILISILAAVQTKSRY